MFDHPGERHSHTRVTPRGGGAGLVLAFLAASLLLTGPDKPESWTLCMMPGVIVIAVLGAIDDHRSLNILLRLFVQLAVSTGLVVCAAYAGWIEGVVPMVLAGLFLVWMTNLYNFMDGSNGMAALQGLFAGLVLFFLFQVAGDSFFATLGLLLAACCAGFLPWNTGRAKVFMGDVGSLALGFVLAALLVYGTGSGKFGIPVALMVLLLFLTDSTMTLLARVIRGERWYNPHRQHLYQRLIAHGWTHGQVALLYQAVNLAFVLPGIVIAVRVPTSAWAVALAEIIVGLVIWYLLVRRFEVPVQTG